MSAEIKHGERWLTRIQARENIEIKKEVIRDVKRKIRDDDIRDVRKITYEKIREYLRATKNTRENEHVPLIIKIITGISPPQLRFWKVVCLFMKKWMVS